MVQSGIKPHEALDELMPFERLLTEISTLFINLPADQINNEIASAQKRICELLDIDRSTLFLSSQDDPGILLLTHMHQPPDLPPPPACLNAKDHFPWTVRKILGGETFAISKMTELPAEAGRDRENFGLYGTRSGVYVPLSIGSGPVFGVLAFAVTREERDWSKRVVQQFQLVAQIFANALARERSERKLVESEQRLRLITNALPVLIAYVDVELRYRFNNDAYRAWFGVSPDEALGRHIREVAGEGFFQAARPHLERALSGERVRCALDVATAAGRPLSVEAIYVPDVGGHDAKVRGIYVLAIDVTERNLAQREAQRLHDELLHAGRISTLGELAGVLAHEINQPLSAIMSNAQAAKRYLRASTPDLEEVKGILDDIIKEDARASDVINRMRAFLRKSKMEFAPLSLNSVFRDIVMLVKGDAMRRDIKIDLDLDPRVPPVRGDKIQLQQVALNLVLNAFDSLNEQTRRKRRVQIRTYPQNAQVLAAVEDNGIGMAVGDAEKIFDHFYTTKTEGLGMGLSICRAIIARHQGHIWAENQRDEGATFYFSLPAASA